MTRDYFKEFQAKGGEVKRLPSGIAYGLDKDADKAKRHAGQPQRDFTPRLAATDHADREVWVNDIGEPIFFGWDLQKGPPVDLSDRLLRVALAGAIPADDQSVIADAQAEIERLRATFEALRAIIADCPYVIDPATVPAGKQPCDAPDQVVGTLHMSGRYYANAVSAIAKAIV